jgi:putative ABC transport system permease protein
MRLVLGRGLGIAAAGVALGVIGSLAVTRLLTSQLYGIRPTDPSTLAAAALVMVLVALLACYVPARRATEMDPAVTLRSE